MKEETSNAFVASMSPSPDQIGEMAERAQVKRLFITHMRKTSDTEEGRAAALRDLEANFSGQAAIAEDLMELDL